MNKLTAAVLFHLAGTRTALLPHQPRRAVTLVSLLLGFGTANVGYAQPHCCYINSNDSFSVSYTVDYYIDWNGATISSSSGMVDVQAAVAGLGASNMSSPCGSTGTNATCTQFDEDGDSSSDLSINTAGLSQAYASCYPSYSSVANAEGYVAIDSAYIYVGTFSDHFESKAYEHGTGCNGPYHGDAWSMTLAAAQVILDAAYTFTQGSSAPRITYTVSVDMTYGDPNASPSGYPQSGVTVRPGYLQVGTPPFLPSSGVRNGVIGRKPDGTIVRLGLFAGSSFTPASTSGAEYEIVDSVSDDVTLPGNATSFSPDVSTDYFSHFDGDIDGDGEVCRFADRYAFSVTSGSDLTDVTYRARADFDLDGDVDGADFTAFDLLVADPDFNLDGNVDQDDVGDLGNMINGGGPPGGNPTADPDYNRDGNVDQDDLSALIDDVAGGC